MVVDNEGRQSYPPAPTRGGNPNAPMPEDANADSSPADASSVSSTDGQEQVSQEGTAPSTQPESKFHMPPESRWQELIDQKNKAEQLARLALEKLQAPQAPVAPVEDHWKGLVDHPDPATAQFYQQQRGLFQREAERMADQKLQGVLQAVDAGRRELAEIKISQFRKDNPEITVGSPEESAIAGYVQQGFDLQNAKKLALYDKLEAENRALKTKGQQRSNALPQKIAANVESGSGVPETAGLPGQHMTFADRAAKIYDESGGDIKQVLKAVFHKKR